MNTAQHEIAGKCKWQHVEILWSVGIPAFEAVGKVVALACYSAVF